MQRTEQSIEPGETVYWQPSLEGAPDEDAKLTYRYSWGETSGLQENLELRAMMDWQGLYGSKTYALSNNWMGMLSSAVHWSAVETDVETGELVVRRYGATPEDGPYAIGNYMDGMPAVRGKTLPPETTDGRAVQ